jgi:hypothetical protein
MFGLAGGNPASDLHDEYNRVFEHDAANGDEEQVTIPERRGRIQADVLGAKEYQQAVDDTDKELERCDEPVRDPVQGASPAGWAQPKLTYNECLEPPASKFYLRN